MHTHTYALPDMVPYISAVLQLAALLRIEAGPSYWDHLPAVLTVLAGAGVLIAYIWGVQASSHDDENEVH
jgi:hypothetical protein